MKISELEDSLKSFKGSKAQRKNAEKELKKMKLSLAEEELQEKKDLQERLEMLRRHIEEDLVGFWWEIYGPNELKDTLREISLVESKLC